MNRMRRLTVLSLLSFLGLALPVWATCGGGGGGGRGGAGQTYRTNWFAADWDKLLLRARSRSEGLVLYFVPEGGKEHRFFRTKWPNDASKERLFFKVEGDGGQARKLRLQFKARANRHVLHVCDWHGNSFKRFERKGKAKFSGQAVKATLYGMAKLVKRLEKKLEAKATAAEQADKKGKLSAAIRAAGDVIGYTGYPAVKRAQVVWDRLVAAGMKAIESANEFESAERRKALTEIKRRYRGTPVAERAALELDPRSKARRGSDSQSIGELAETIGNRRLVDETWDEAFGLAAWTPSPAERLDAALAAGCAHEQAGRYQEARASYVLAAGFDPNDPVPLVHLGELYRHHLGLWDEAEKVFRRALALDSNDFATAIALHGIGKMTIWRGDNRKGLELFARSIARRPTALCYRNLAVYFNTEGEAKTAFAYATKAYELDPEDSYNQVFFSVYLLMDGQRERAHRLMAKAEFDPSMSYNYACYYAVQKRRDLVLKYLKKHFYEYESCDAVRSFEMAEARMDLFFEPWYGDAEFRQITVLAGKTPWLK